MARTKRVVVDAAVKADGQHGTHVKSTRAPADTSRTVATREWLRQGRCTDLGGPDDSEEGAHVQPCS
jgi:hypothetical protein